MQAFTTLIDDFLGKMRAIMQRRGDTDACARIDDVRAIYTKFAESKRPSERRLVLVAVMQELAPHEALIRARDPALITQHLNGVDIFRALRFDEHWSSFNPKQQAGIWEFITQLHAYGAMLMGLTDEEFGKVDTELARIYDAMQLMQPPPQPPQ